MRSGIFDPISKSRRHTFHIEMKNIGSNHKLPRFRTQVKYFKRAKNKIQGNKYQSIKHPAAQLKIEIIVV